jgi:hypothetical protein
VRCEGAIHVDFPEAPSQGDVLFLRQVLVAKKQQTACVEGRADLSELRVTEGAQIDAGHLGTDVGECVDLEPAHVRLRWCCRQ